MTDLARILEALVAPLGLIWLMNLTATVIFLAKRKFANAAFCAAIALLLFVFGSTPISAHLLASLEKPYAAQRLEGLSNGDAVVVLGGFLWPSSHDIFGFQFDDGADRAITALELMKQGKAPVLVLGGGGSVRRGWSESKFLTNWISAWHLPAGAVQMIPICANTREEALHVQGLFQKHGWKRVYLVTSAYHLKRAEAIFRQLNIPVVAVACDFVGMSRLEAGKPFNPVPMPDRLEILGLYLHEQIGWWVYRARGWVGGKAQEL